MPGRKLTPVDLETLAARRLQGWQVPDLAKFYGYSEGGMRSLLDSDEVQAIAARRRDAIDTVGARILARWALRADYYADQMSRRAEDPDDKHSFDAQRYILDRLLPSKTTTVSETNITFNQQTNNVLANIGDTLSGIRDIVASSRGQFDCTEYVTTDSRGLVEAADAPDRTQPAPPNGASGDNSDH